MLVEQMLERVRERLAVVDAAASIKDVAGVMAKPQAALDAIAWKLNTRPRRMHDFHSPLEVYRAHLVSHAQAELAREQATT